MRHDYKCEELAEHFLEGEPIRDERTAAMERRDLAEAIQSAIEDWFLNKGRTLEWE